MIRSLALGGLFSFVALLSRLGGSEVVCTSNVFLSCAFFASFLTTYYTTEKFIIRNACSSTVWQLFTALSITLNDKNTYTRADNIISVVAPGS